MSVESLDGLWRPGDIGIDEVVRELEIDAIVRERRRATKIERDIFRNVLQYHEVPGGSD